MNRGRVGIERILGRVRASKRDGVGIDLRAWRVRRSLPGTSPGPGLARGQGGQDADDDAGAGGTQSESEQCAPQGVPEEESDEATRPGAGAG